MHSVDSSDSFDHPVGHRKQGWRNFDRERLCSLEVGDQLEFRWLLDRQIGGLGAFNILFPEDYHFATGRRVSSAAA